jgi:hypothetical protein
MNRISENRLSFYPANPVHPCWIRKGTLHEFENPNTRMEADSAGRNSCIRVGLSFVEGYFKDPPKGRNIPRRSIIINVHQTACFYIRVYDIYTDLPIPRISCLYYVGQAE